MRIAIALSVLAATGLFAGAVLAADATKPGDAKAPAAAPAAAAKASSTELKDLKFSLLDPNNPKGPSMAVINGDPKTGPVEIELKIPAGFKSGEHSHSSDYRAVVVQGAPAHGDDEKSLKTHAPGATWFEPAHHNHFDTCTSKEDCLAVVYFPNGFDFVPAAPAAPAGKK